VFNLRVGATFKAYRNTWLQLLQYVCEDGASVDSNPSPFHNLTYLYCSDLAVQDNSGFIVAVCGMHIIGDKKTSHFQTRTLHE